MNLDHPGTRHSADECPIFDGSPVVTAKALPPRRVTENRWALVGLAIACFLFAAFIAGQAVGQAPAAKPAYDTFKVNPAYLAEANVKTMKAEAKSFVLTGKSTRGIQYVDAYYKQYVPAAMTGPNSSELISEIVDEVNSFASRALTSRNPQVPQKIIPLTKAVMGAIATGNYNPQARIAATLMLASLDEKAGDKVNKRMPVPYRGVLDTLVKLYANEQNPEGLRAAALTGIHRHVACTFPRLTANAKKQISDEMTKLLDAETPPERSAMAHAYLQRYAVDILNYLRPKADGALATKLITISTEPKSPNMIALHSAAKLGTMSQELAGSVADPDPILANWTERTILAFEGEIARLKAMDKRVSNVAQPRAPSTFLRKPEVKKKSRSAGRSMESMEEMMMDDMMMEDMGMDEMMMDAMDEGGMEMMDDYGFATVAPEVVQPPEIIASLRKLNHVLEQVHQGTTGSRGTGMPTSKKGGLLASVPAEKQASISAWIDAMKTVVDAVNEPTIEERKDFVKMLQDQVEALKAIAGQSPAGEEGGQEGGDLNAELDLDLAGF